MTAALLSYQILVAVLAALARALNPYKVLLALSILAFSFKNHEAFLAALVLWSLNLLFDSLSDRLQVVRSRFFPLGYAAFCLICHDIFDWRISGFSYILLAATLDLHWQVHKGRKKGDRFLSFFNLASYPKAFIGPIAGFKDHSLREHNAESRYQAFQMALLGVFKALILLNIFRFYFPEPFWQEAGPTVSYLGFGLWNYINLYLEFSGFTEIVVSMFLLVGINCPKNFDAPYLSLSVTEFWKRWHMTLGRWIREHIYIPFGGSRVVHWRIHFNLIFAMTLCGLWHGLTWNFLAWGLMQGIALSIERLLSFEEKLRNAHQLRKGGHWLVTQVFVTLSWSVFFGRI